jgi:hypothetical protein
MINPCITGGQDILVRIGRCTQFLHAILTEESLFAEIENGKSEIESFT